MFDQQLPRDPFADDPNDPAKLIDDDADDFPPITEEDRQYAREDLHVVLLIKDVLGAHGVQGVMMMCDHCEEPHYYDWAMMVEQLNATIQGAVPPMHEPSPKLDTTRFVTWDYCLGYADGLRRS